MEFNIRQLNPSDYDDILVGWWKDWGWKEAPAKDFLPNDGQGGVIVFDNDTPVCAGFLYVGSNAQVAWIEWIVSNKKVKENRKEALNYLLESLILYCKELNMKYVFASNNNIHLINRFEELGFIKGSTSTELIKKI